MRVLKSILRLFLAVQAIILVLVPFGGLVARLRSHAASAFVARGIVSEVAVSALFLAVGAVFAMAWWTTRKPSQKLNLWALSASLIYLLEGIAVFLIARHFVHSAGTGLDLAAVGAGGLFAFSRPETALSDLAPPRRTSIAGDRTSPATRHAVTVLSTLAQIAALILWSRWAYWNHIHGAQGLAWIALVTLACLLGTIVHECGHAVMAWCFQMGMLSFRAGPFTWRLREGKWQFKFHAAGLLTPGGAVGVVPTEVNPPRWEEVVVLAAGPLANLLFGFPAVYAVVHDRWASYQHSWEFVAFAGSFSLIVGALNLIPFLSEDGAYSDGARILQIVTHSPLDDYHRAMTSIAATVLTPRRYRDLDIGQIERAAILFPDEFRGLHLLLCACHFYEDSGKLPEAATALSAAESIYNSNQVELPGPLHTIFIFGHAYLNHDAAAARLWWERMEAKGIERTDFDYWLAKAALLWIEGNRPAAEDAWYQANLEAQSLPARGAYEFDRDRCGLLREALDGPAIAAAAPREIAAAASAPPAASLPNEIVGSDIEVEATPTAPPASAGTAQPAENPIAALMPQRTLLPNLTACATVPAVFTIPMPTTSTTVAAIAPTPPTTTLPPVVAVLDVPAKRNDVSKSDLPVASPSASEIAPKEAAVLIAKAPAQVEARPAEPPTRELPQDPIAAALSRLIPVRKAEPEAVPKPLPVGSGISETVSLRLIAALPVAEEIEPVEADIPEPPVSTRREPKELVEVGPFIEDSQQLPEPVPATAAIEPAASDAIPEAILASSPARADEPEIRLPDPPAPAPPARDPLAFFQTSKPAKEVDSHSVAPAWIGSKTGQPSAAGEKSSVPAAAAETAPELRRQPASDPLAFFRSAAPSAVQPAAASQAAPRPASDPLAFFRPKPKPQEPPPIEQFEQIAAEGREPILDEPQVPIGEPASNAEAEDATSPPVVTVEAEPPPAPVLAEPVAVKPDADVTVTEPGAPDVAVQEIEPIVISEGTTGSYTRIPANGMLPPKPRLVDLPKVDPLEVIRSQMIDDLRKSAASETSSRQPRSKGRVFSRR